MTALAAMAAPDTGEAPLNAPAPLRVAYVMSRFPKISETFILTEILALERRGVRVEVYPLLRERAGLVHPEARAVVDRAHYLPFASRAILASQLYWLRRRPQCQVRRAVHGPA